MLGQRMCKAAMARSHAYCRSRGGRHFGFVGYLTIKGHNKRLVGFLGVSGASSQEPRRCDFL